MLDWMQGYLHQHDDENPLLSSQWLISDAVGMDRLGLYTSLDRPLSNEELDTLRTNVKRRSQGEPLQYILGKTWFRYIPIIVEKDVLIPRPETEVLVSEVLDHLPKPEKIRSLEYRMVDDEDDSRSISESGSSDGATSGRSPLNTSVTTDGSILVADIGTGSGCIACSLAYEHPDIHVYATDISKSALTLAKKNIDGLGFGSRVDLIECSMATGIEGLNGSFDAIVSNPPYIPTEELKELSKEVIDFEPRIALDGGSDGLDPFRELLIAGKDLLKEDGLLAVELHETTLDYAADLAEISGFHSIAIVKDLAGKDRILKCLKDSM